MSGAFLPSSAIPDPLADDDDDVAWALQTAAVQWKRGLYADAIVWLRRAADSAIQVGQSDRAADLIETAVHLTDSMMETAAQTGSLAPSAPPQRPSESANIDALLDAVDDDEPEVEEVQVLVSQPPTPPPPQRFSPGPPPPPARGVLSGFPSPPQQNADLAWRGAPPPPPPPPPVRLPAAPPAPPARTGSSLTPLPRFQSSAPPPAPQRLSTRPPDSLPLRPSDRSRQVFEPAFERPRGSPPPAPMRGLSSQPPAGSVPPAVRSSSIPPVRERQDSASEQAPKKRSLRKLIEKLQQLPEEAPPRRSQRPLPSPEPVAEDRGAVEEDTTATGRVSVPPIPEPGASERPASERPASEPPASERPASERPLSLAPLGVDRESSPPSAPTSRRRGEPSRSILGVALSEVRGLQDLPEEEQVALVKQAKLEALKPEEECSFFAVALVVKGWVHIVPAISDTACAVASAGEVVFTQGNLEQGVALGMVAGDEGAFVAVWDQPTLDRATASCPWVQDELRAVADRFQALAGAALGPLGEGMDDALRAMVTERCEVRLLLPGDVAIAKGTNVGGLQVVGAGRIEIVQGEGASAKVLKELNPGEVLFGPQVLVASAAPATARAGSSGALLLHAGRHETHELMVVVPPLVEVLAG